MLSQKAKDLLNQLREVVKAEGSNLICVLSDYSNADDADGRPSADFSTAISICEAADTGEAGHPSFDHILLDSIREVSVEWSNISHKSQLKWNEAA